MCRLLYKEQRGSYMSKQQTIQINGLLYDAQSGEPVGTTRQHRQHQPAHATNVHAKQTKSTALNRKYIDMSMRPKAKTGPKQVVSRSPQISKFAPDPKPVVKAKQSMDIAPVKHPVVAKAHAHSAHHAHPVAQTHIPAKEVKNQVISQALENAKPTKHKQHKTKRASKGRVFNVASASLALLLLAGYLTYLNMPNLSVRVAAAQAGIEAAYPEYQPSGYRLDGPVAYTNGEVRMTFAANAGQQKFALNQSKSSWDSSALLTNYVEPASNGQYETFSDAGLTIYTYGNNAAWVNGGILYTIRGDAVLSNQQVRNIASSM